MAEQIPEKERAWAKQRASGNPDLNIKVCHATSWTVYVELTFVRVGMTFSRGTRLDEMDG